MAAGLDGKVLEDNMWAYACEQTLTSCAQLSRNPRGLSTCSRTSMEQTTSKEAGPRSARRSSTDVCLYVSEPVRAFASFREDKAGSADAWSDAIEMFDMEASIPVVRAPRRARLCGIFIRQDICYRCAGILR